MGHSTSQPTSWYPHHTLTISWPPLYSCAQLVFGPVGNLRPHGGLNLLDILGAFPVGRSDLRISLLCPLLSQFWSLTYMSQICSHLLPASIWLLSPDTIYSYERTLHAYVSGGGGPSSQTPSADQQPADCKGSRLGRFWRWGLLTIWDLGPKSISGPPPSPLNAPRWR